MIPSYIDILGFEDDTKQMSTKGKPYYGADTSKVYVEKKGAALPPKEKLTKEQEEAEFNKLNADEKINKTNLQDTYKAIEEDVYKNTGEYPAWAYVREYNPDLFASYGLDFFDAIEKANPRVIDFFKDLLYKNNRRPESAEARRKEAREDVEYLMEKELKKKGMSEAGKTYDYNPKKDKIIDILPE